MKYRGTSIYPNAIIEAVRGLPAVLDCVLVAEEQEPLSDRLSLHVQIRGGGTPTAELRKAIEGHLRTLLRATPQVTYVDEAAIRALQQAGGRKAARFIDRRRGR